MRIRDLAITALLLVFATSAFAQLNPLPTQYRLTRYALAETNVTLIFQKSAMVCGIPRAVSTVRPSLRINDPADDTLDCEYTGAMNILSNLTPGKTYTFTIAASDASGIWSPESAPVLFNTFTAPNNLRVVPSVLGVVVNGTVQQRFPFQMGRDTLDVATAYLDGLGASFPVHIGAWTLTSATHNVRAGDRVAIAFWREGK